MNDSHDRRVLRRIAAEDADALGDLYDRHAGLLAMRLRRAGASPAEMEDVLQETFIDVWRCAESFRGEGTVAAWLWGMARRKFAMVVRGEVRSRAREQAVTSGVTNPGSEEAAWVTAVDAGQVLKGLGPDLRAAFEAVIVDDMSIREAADHLGVPEGTIKSRVHRARQAIKKEMR